MPLSSSIRLFPLLMRFMPKTFVVNCRAFSTRPSLFYENLIGRPQTSNASQEAFRNFASSPQVDEPVEEYYVIDVDESGVVVPMIAEKEPYLRHDLVKRPLNALTVDELVDVLRDQRASNITVIQHQLDNIVDSGDSPSFVIICSPFNTRHGKALMVVLRTFLKRNFIITKPNSEIPRRHEKVPRWNVMKMADIVVHILDEELRRKYDLESMFLGLDGDGTEEDGTFNTPSWKNEYRVPEEMLIKTSSQRAVDKQRHIR